MAEEAATTTIATSATAVDLPSKPGAGSTGPQWATLDFCNTGTTTVWICQTGDDAEAEADENIAIPAGTSVERPYKATSAIAVTSASTLQVTGLLGTPGSVY